MRPSARRAGLAVAGGALLFAGHPPLGFAPAGVVALVPLLMLARDVGRQPRALRAGFGWGLLAGGVFFTPLLYWIAFVEAVALPLLVLTQAATVGAFVAGLAAWGPRPWRPLAAVVWWLALEAVRSAAPWGGFPWGVLGYTQHGGGLLLPLARTFGVLGVSAACAGIAAAVEELGARLADLRTVPGEDGNGLRPALAVARAPLLGLLAVLVVAVLVGAPPPRGDGRSLDVAAVQGNDIIDTASLSRGRVLAVAERMTQLTERIAAAPGPPPDLVVWPENSLDADVTTEGNEALAALVDRALDALDGVPLITGMLREREGDGAWLNTMVQLAPDRRVVDLYAKRSLVPFGEFVPLREYLGGFPPLERAGNFTAGEGPGVFQVGGARLGTVICFENTFPELTRSQVREGADVLVVSTNNASFGRSPASSQHLAFSQLRAVESGRWVLHAGISGISAVIDPHGRVHERTGLFEQVIVRAELPLIEDTTLFIRVGDLLGPLAMALAAAGMLGVAGTHRRGWRHGGVGR